HQRLFDIHYALVHEGCRYREDDHARHYQVQLENLPSIYDQVPEPGFRNQELAHYDAYPRKPDVYFQRIDYYRVRRRQHHLCENLQPVCPESPDQLDFFPVHRHEAAEHFQYRHDQRDGKRYGYYGSRAGADPDYEDRTESYLGKAVENYQVRFQDLRQQFGPPEYHGYQRARRSPQHEPDHRFKACYPGM